MVLCESLLEIAVKSNKTFHLVLVTCANLLQAKLIARTVIEKRLAACVNILRHPVESHYRWKGRVESARELLLLIKTTAPKLSQLEKEVQRLHSYAVPEFLVLPVSGGSPDYLHWIAESTK
jgi:periplasmic divalent cation tolerance protein